MGVSQSSIEKKYSNDFELVIRVSKDLERALGKRFSCYSGTLMEKVRSVEDKVTKSTYSAIVYLVKLRIFEVLAILISVISFRTVR